MDALTWFKTAFRRGLTTPAPLRADVASEDWGDVPLHLAAARLRPPPVSGDADDDWDVVIARAKLQAAEMQPMQKTPPPARAPQAVRAKLDAAWGGLKKRGRPAPEDRVTPPPAGVRRGPRPLIGPAGRAFRGPSGRSRG